MSASLDLVDLAARLAHGARPEEEVEAYVTHARTFETRAYDGEIESVSSAEPRGAGVRVVADGRVGFAYTTELDEGGLDDVVAAARDNASHATADEAAGLAPSWERAPEDIPELVDAGQERVSPEQKTAFVLELERAASGQDARVKAVEDAVYADSQSRVAIATSTGVTGVYERTDAWSYVVAIVEEDSDTQMGFEFGLARSLQTLDPAWIAEMAVRRGLGVLGARKIPSTKLPVVFDPYVAGQFLGVVGQALTGDAVQKGRSLFADKMGDRVAAEGLTLVDDGRLKDAPGAAPWDDEGVPTRRTEVISEGRLTSFLYDTRSARREGRASTGNAARAGFKSVPHPSPTNLTFESSAVTAEEVLRRAGRALLVQDFHGVHSGANPVSGDFSVGATGLLLDDGAPGQPVKEVTIAAPMLDILDRIEVVASDRRWLPFGGSYGGATTLVAEMTIAGE